MAPLTDDTYLPEEVKCPNCASRLRLSSIERRRKLVNCPECNTLADFTDVSGSPRNYELSDPLTRPYPASTGKRLANYLIDSFIAGIANLFALAAIMEVFETVFGSADGLAILLAYLVLPITYYLGSELSLQKTPAKFLTRTRVVMEDGSKPDAGSILIRTISRFVPFDPVSGIFSDDGWWHDRWSKTMVVDD